MRPLIVTLSIVVLASSAGAEEGRWVAGFDVAPASVTCTRTYRCVPDREVKLAPDEKIASTPQRLVSGVCARGIGPLATCTQCLTSPPKDRCSWEVVKK